VGDGAPTPDELLRAAGLLTLGDDPPLEAVSTVLETLSNRLNGAGALDRVVAREGAIRALKDAGVGAPARLVDAALSGGESDEPAPKQGRRITLQDPEPSPGPVDGAELLDDLAGWIGSYLHFPRAAAWACALWVMATWFVEELYFAPPLIAQSPTKRAGKTLLLDLLRWPARRGYLTSGIGVTPAVLFRLNEATRPTFLIDEAERLGGRGADRDLVGLLNAGYRRGATVSRCVEPDFQVVQFDAFGFRALAAIGSLWDTIEDRAIIIPLQRKPDGASVRRFSARHVEREGRDLARRAARFAADVAGRVAEEEERAPRPSDLDDRACDSWAPLFAVARVAGGEWPDRAREAALKLSTEKEDEDRAERMIHDLHRVFAEHGDPEAFASGDLVEKLNGIETSPWGDLRKGDGLTPHKLAAMLRPFDVGPVQRRTSAGAKVRGWWLDDLEPLFTRYVSPTPPPEVGQVGQSSNGAGSDGFQSGTGNDGCPSSAPAETPCESRDVPVVPLREGGGHEGGTPPDGGEPDLWTGGLADPDGTTSDGPDETDGRDDRPAVEL